jgi:molybdopterin-guanine dinucleotide biosynthesis protein A
MPDPTPDLAPLAGLILSGGRSRRFGVDKAGAQLDGRTLLERAAANLSAACAWTAVSARPGSVGEQAAMRLGLVVLADRPSDPEGPLAGVRRGLEWAGGLGAAALLVRPVDTPFLPADLAQTLARRLSEEPDAPAAYVVTEEGPQPLCALWRLSALKALAAELDAGEHPSVQRYLKALGAAPMMMADAAAFANINTPQDLSDALKR